MLRTKWGSFLFTDIQIQCYERSGADFQCLCFVPTSISSARKIVDINSVSFGCALETWHLGFSKSVLCAWITIAFTSRSVIPARKSLHAEFLAAEYEDEIPDDGELEGSGDDYKVDTIQMHPTLNTQTIELDIPQRLSP